MRQVRSSLLLVLLLLPVSAAAEQPPNIVLVIGDDHGWPDSGFMGHSVVETPALDALAAEGTLFTNAQLPASVCRPSLQNLLSGLHPQQWRAKRNALVAAGELPFVLFPELFRREVEHYRTLPRELARRGYRSWEGGKMWENTFEAAGFTHGMAETLLPTPHSDGQQLGREDWDPARCGASRHLDQPCPALDPLREFFDEIGEAPFFLWFAPMLPHFPFDPPVQFTDPYQDRGLSENEIVYYAQVTRMDAVIGELIRELEARGHQDDTLVIFVSDNGWEIGQGFFSDLGHGKGSLHELGTRTPLIFHWPGRVPAGVVRDELVSAEDLFPTILEYAGAEPLPDRRGVSLKRAIEAEAPVGLDQYVSFFQGGAEIYRGHYVRTPQWRYLSVADGHEELYEIQLDPFEEHDLSSSRPDLLPGFRDAVLAWESERSEAPPRLEIAGRLVGEDGSPIPGASLILHSASAPLEVLTNADGEFRFQNLPHGDYSLSPGQRLTSLEPVSVSIPLGPTGSYLPRIVGSPGELLERPAASTISGRLATRAGEPLADARVFVKDRRRQRGLQVAVRTDANGRYLAENLPAGVYSIRAEVPDGLRSRRAVCRLESDAACTRDLVVRERTSTRR
jgi:arylsulfatase A-like enzyme